MAHEFNEKVTTMTKLKLGFAAGVAAILAFGVAACGQTTTVTEEPMAEAPVAEPAMADAPMEAPVDAAAAGAAGTMPEGSPAPADPAAAAAH